MGMANLQKMSNLDYFYLAEELQPLVGGYLSKIYELRTNLFRFKVRGDKEYNFIAELGLRAHLSKYAEESPETPTNFTMLLRKHLDNARITEIKQENEDRLLVFTLQKKEEYHLIFEMFAKGNLILATADYTILASYKKDQGKARVIRKGETYAALQNNFKLPEKPPKAPTVYFEDGSPVAYAAFEASKFPELEKVGFPTISEAADEYYFKVRDVGGEKEEAKTEASLETEKAIKKLETTLMQQRKAHRKFSEEAEDCQKAGDYVYANFEAVEKLLKLARELRRQGRNSGEIEAQILSTLNLKASVEKDMIRIDVEQKAE